MLCERRVVNADEAKPVNTGSNDPNRASAKAFHQQFAEFLKTFVDEVGMVDYTALRRKRLDLRALLRTFDTLDPNVYQSWSKEDKIALWINVYNLQKLRVVTDNYPIRPMSRILSILLGPPSIRHIERDITKHKFLVMDEEFNLCTGLKGVSSGKSLRIQESFLPCRMHVFRVRRSGTALYGSKLGKQLDDQARKFLAGPLAFKIDRDKEKVYLSALFQRSSYGGEFTEKHAIDRKFRDHPPPTRAILNFICQYVSPQDVSFLEVGNYTVEYMRYDWTINDGS